MKAFIIYIENHDESIRYANACKESCEGKFDAELFPATTPHNIVEHTSERDYEPINPSRAYDFKSQAKNANSIKLYTTKKSIFITATRLWKLCVELNEPIVVLEHDSHCVRAWDNPKFKDVLILNGQSCWSQKSVKGFKPNKMPNGVHSFQTKLKYRFHNKFKSSMLMPGAAAYAIHPHAAQKLLDAGYKYGWEQNDHFINTYNVNIETVIPEYFTFKLPNLKTSHGF